MHSSNAKILGSAARAAYEQGTPHAGVTGVRACPCHNHAASLHVSRNLQSGCCGNSFGTPSACMHCKCLQGVEGLVAPMCGSLSSRCRQGMLTCVLMPGEVEVGRELGHRSREAHTLAQDARAAANAAASNACNLAITNRFKACLGSQSQRCCVVATSASSVGWCPSAGAARHALAAPGLQPALTVELSAGGPARHVRGGGAHRAGPPPDQPGRPRWPKRYYLAGRPWIWFWHGSAVQEASREASSLQRARKC